MRFTRKSYSIKPKIIKEAIAKTTVILIQRDTPPDILPWKASFLPIHFTIFRRAETKEKRFRKFLISFRQFLTVFDRLILNFLVFALFSPIKSSQKCSL